MLSETTGSTTTSYAYAGGPLELDRSGTTYWYLSDTLGSVRLLTDSTGATPATYAYAAFGSTRKSTGSIANEVRFSGERTDTESGLEFLRARTYDPSTGTFLQRDTWGISPTDSQSMDAYAYTENSPVNATDPSGHCGIFDPLGCASDVVGGVGNKVSDLAGGVGNAVNDPGKTLTDTATYVNDHKATLIFAVTMAGCTVGLLSGVATGFAAAACGAYLIGGGAGAGGYTGVTVGSNLVGNRSVLDGFDMDKASSAGIAGGVTAAACMSSMGTQCVTVGAASSAIQYGYDTATTPTQDPVGWGISGLAGGLLARFGGKTFRDLKATDASSQTNWFGPRGIAKPTIRSSIGTAIKGGAVSGGASWLSGASHEYLCRGRMCAK